jgi:hypothetical protein
MRRLPKLFSLLISTNWFFFSLQVKTISVLTTGIKMSDGRQSLKKMALGCARGKQIKAWLHRYTIDIRKLWLRWRVGDVLIKNTKPHKEISVFL